MFKSMEETYTVAEFKDDIEPLTYIALLVCGGYYGGLIRRRGNRSPVPTLTTACRHSLWVTTSF